MSRPRSSWSPEWTFTLGFSVGLMALTLVHTLLPSSSVDRDIELVRAVRDLAQDTYVGETDSRALIDDALAGMVAGLDRYSRYYGPQEIAEITRETSGEYKGIGVVFRDPVEAGQVRFPLWNSPAHRAGVRVGDRFVEVAGKAVLEMEPEELRETLRNARGDLAILLEHRDGTREEVSLQPEAVIDPTVRHARMLDADLGIGYLAITSFSHRTVEEFDRSTAWLLERGMEALVVDLRSNPGGILDAAVRVADRFIDEGTIVSTRTRRETRSTLATEAETLLGGLPLVLLIDEDSASASEVLVGAIQDHRVGTIVGEPSYGKGAVQTLRHFERDQAIIKITTSNYFTPAGRRIERGDERHGIAPDLLVETDARERLSLHRYLMSYSPPLPIRPEVEAWEQEEGVVLYAKAPPDPQLEAALDLLRGDLPRTHAPD